MSTQSHLGRKQRKDRLEADHRERAHRLALSLSRELRTRYGRRRLTVHKGDTVRILGGSYAGREERVARVDRRRYRVVLDNVTLKKADAKLIQLPLTPGHLMLTKLNLGDPWRRRILRVTTAEGEEAVPELPPETDSAASPAKEAEGEEGP